MQILWGKFRKNWCMLWPKTFDKSCSAMRIEQKFAWVFGLFNTSFISHPPTVHAFIHILQWKYKQSRETFFPPTIFFKNLYINYKEWCYPCLYTLLDNIPVRAHPGWLPLWLCFDSHHRLSPGIGPVLLLGLALPRTQPPLFSRNVANINCAELLCTVMHSNTLHYTALWTPLNCKLIHCPTLLCTALNTVVFNS